MRKLSNIKYWCLVCIAALTLSVAAYFLLAQPVSQHYLNDQGKEVLAISDPQAKLYQDEALKYFLLTCICTLISVGCCFLLFRVSPWTCAIIAIVVLLQIVAEIAFVVEASILRNTYSVVVYGI